MIEINQVDLTKAQIYSKAGLDKSKICDTCKYRNISGGEPCISCVDNFLGVVFVPSNWKKYKKGKK